MTVSVEIQTIEQSERLRWMPIARFVGPTMGSEARDATIWGDRILAGFTDGPMKPFLRLVNGNGDPIGSWQAEGYEEGIADAV